MTKGFAAVSILVIITGLATGIGLGMWQAATPTSAGQAGQATAPTTGGPAVAPATNSEATAGMGRGSLPIVGAIESMQGDTLSVRTANGTVQANLTTSTAIHKTANVSASQVLHGDTVSATGQRGTDGTIAGRLVQIGVTVQADQGAQAAGMFTRQGAGTGQQAAGTVGGMAQVAGTVESVAQDKLVAKTSTGSVTITLSDQTSIRKTVDGARSDLAQGVNVAVAGQQGADGRVVASSIQILPEASQGVQRPNR